MNRTNGARGASALNGEWQEHSFVYPTFDEAKQVLDAVQILYVPEKGWSMLKSQVEEVSGGFRAMWCAKYEAIVA